MKENRSALTISLPLLTAIILSSPGSFAQSGQPTPSGSSEVVAGVERPMGFQEWKQKRIAKARLDLNDFKKPRDNNSLNGSQPTVGEPAPSGTQAPAGPLKEAELKQQAERLRQLEFNLEIALGLTIHDFFALYLKDKGKLEMAQVVNQLSAEELSELLVSYRDVLYGPPVVEANKAGTIR